jgi:archaellum component FlaG (FlaF/FlaG flagellin family)
MDKIIVTLLLVIAGVVCSLVVVNAMYPVITSSSGAIVDAATKIDDRIRSQIKIIEIADQNDTVFIWIKNVGSSRIGGIESSDVFFGPEGDFARVTYGGSTAPYWDYAIENDTKWGPSATIKISIHLQSAPSGTCYFKIVIPNGISDGKLFSTS